MKRHRIRRVLAAVIGGAIVVAAGIDAHSGASSSDLRNSITLFVPSAPGGTWDTNARELQHAMVENDIVVKTQVINMPGGAGTLGLNQLIQMDSRSDVLMLTGTVMLGGVEVNDAENAVADATPIARIVEDYQAVFVPADSPFENLDDLISAWQKDPGGTAIGGGAIGGTDSLLAASLAGEIGIDPKGINYITFSGGGEVLPALLSHTVDAAIGGYAEFEDQVEAGKLRALALTAPEPKPGINVPTFKQQGIDLYLPNWQGLMAPPGISDDERQELTDIVTETLATEEWQRALERNRWTGVELTDEPFDEFVRSETERIEGVINESGI